MTPRLVSLAGVVFKTKKELREHIRSLLARRVMWEEFESDLLSELIAKYHHYCGAVGLRPERFRKVPLPEIPSVGPYEFQGFFPKIGWHGVSWTKCLRAPTYIDEVTMSLRRRVKSVVDGARGGRCARCGSTERLDVHHAGPTFDEMAKAASALLTKEEVEERRYWTWEKEERFNLPEGHPTLRLFDELHAKSLLVTLCKACHRQETRDVEEGRE